MVNYMLYCSKDPSDKPNGGLFMDLTSVTTESPLSVPEIVREIEIFPEEASVNAPSFRLSVSYIPRDTWRTLLKPYQKKNELNKEPTKAEESRFRRAVAQKAFRDWSGVTLYNLCRASDECFNSRQALENAGVNNESEVGFSLENACWLAERLNTEVFQFIIGEIGNLEEFVLEQSKLEKKDEKSS